MKIRIEKPEATNSKEPEQLLTNEGLNSKLDLIYKQQEEILSLCSSLNDKLDILLKNNSK